MKNNAGSLGEDAVATLTRNALVPQSPEIFTHDADGNLTADGHWKVNPTSQPKHGEDQRAKG